MPRRTGRVSDFDALHSRRDDVAMLYAFQARARRGGPACAAARSRCKAAQQRLRRSTTALMLYNDHTIAPGGVFHQACRMGDVFFRTL